MSKKKKNGAGSDGGFNPAQLSTIEEAQEIAAMIDFAGGISPVDDSEDFHNTKSGIYLEPWANPTGETPEPNEDGARPFLFRFNPTPEGFAPAGFNVGLTRQTAIGHAPPAEEGQPPNEPNWDYAIRSLKAEVEQSIQSFKDSL